MKTMKTHGRVLLFAAILFCGLLAPACKKERADPLPAATQVGANTLGCKVNGKSWVAQDSDELFNQAFGVEGGYLANVPTYPTQNNVWVVARRNDGSRLHIYLRNVIKPDIYEFGFNTGTAPNVLAPYNYGHYHDRSGRYLTSGRHEGRVTVTRADTVNSIVSGTFEFTAYDSQTGQTVSITDGRFDARFR